MAFQKTHYPDVTMVDRLADTLRINTERISVWCSASRLVAAFIIIDLQKDLRNGNTQFFDKKKFESSISVVSVNLHRNLLPELRRVFPVSRPSMKISFRQILFATFFQLLIQLRCHQIVLAHVHFYMFLQWDIILRVGCY